MMLATTALLQRLDGSTFTIGSVATVYAVYLLNDGAFFGASSNMHLEGENNLEALLSSQQQAFNLSGIKPEQQI